MNRDSCGESPNAVRIASMWLLMTSGCTCTSGHNTSSNSSCVTSRPLFSMRYWSSANAFGLRNNLLLGGTAVLSPEDLIDLIESERRK